MKVAFHIVKGEKKERPGLDVNLGSLFAAAKAEDTIVKESWNTLGTSVTTISLQLRERSENNIYNLIIWNLRMRQRKKPCQKKT